jgi:DNA-directed RNA polymerase specialized sigma24 family protein
MFTPIVATPRPSRTVDVCGNLTQQQIGDRLGISQMHVSRLLERALAYLRAQITKPAEMT